MDAAAEITVCHGKGRDSYAPYEMIDHAWCEVPGAVTVTDDDGSNQREVPMGIIIDNTQPKNKVLPAPLFYDAVEVADVRRMTVPEYFAEAVRHGHDGPWERE